MIEYQIKDTAVQPLNTSYFIKDLLFSKHIKSLTFNSNGKAYVSLDDDVTSENRTYKSSADNVIYYFEIPDVSSFLSYLYTVQSAAGIPPDQAVYPVYTKNIFSLDFLSLLVSVGIFFLLGRFALQFRRGGTDNMMTRALGIESKHFEVIKNTGVVVRTLCEE